MKMTTIAALAAAQLSVAGLAQAAEPPREELAGQHLGSSEEARISPPPGEEADAIHVRSAPMSAGDKAQGDKPRKRKSTGDKVLTGAAVILGVGALAVGGLLVALFVS